MWTYRIQWPSPFSRDWKTSSFRFDTAGEAASALAKYMAANAEDGTIMRAELVRLNTNTNTATTSKGVQ